MADAFLLFLFRVSYLLIARGFRTIALLSLITRWRLMAQTLVIVIPATAPILALQFLVCSVFSLLGMHLFGGLIYDGNPALAGTLYVNLGFETFNYNDYGSAMATSFNLCVVNKWYVSHQGRVRSSHKLQMGAGFLHCILGDCSCLYIECRGCFFHGGFHEPDGESGKDEITRC